MAASRMVAGRGMFAGHSFAALVESLLPGTYIVRDLTQGPNGDSLDKPFPPGITHDVGRYNERRPGMYETSLFDTVEAADQRNIHIGVDVGGSVGTALHCIYDGVVHSSGNSNMCRAVGLPRHRSSHRHGRGGVGVAVRMPLCVFFRSFCLASWEARRRRN